MQIDIEKSNMPVYMNWVIFSSWIVSLYVVEVKKNHTEMQICMV